MKKDTFSGFHPVVNMLYFVFVIGFAMILNHPLYLGVSLVSAVIYSIYLKGKKGIRFQLLCLLPLMIITMLLNPLFSHQGVTILTYFPNGNPLTLESILYGIAAAVVLITIITWFGCFNEIMTSDKIIYLFGRVIPALSLVLTMALRFVPRFLSQIKQITNARKCIGQGVQEGSMRKRIRHGIKILSVLVMRSMEHSVDTADSMKNRGYGLPGRTEFSIYYFDRRDKYVLVFLLLCGAGIIAGLVSGSLKFLYYPAFGSVILKGTQNVFYIAYVLLCLLPLFINVKEDLKWKSLNRVSPFKT